MKINLANYRRLLNLPSEDLMNAKNLKASFLSFAGLISMCQWTQAQVIYSQDFSSVTNPGTDPTPYIGGYYAPQLGFQRFAVPSDQANLVSGGLEVQNQASSAHRGAAVVISPSLFLGPGQYQLSFDMPAATLEPGDSANVRIWEGSGYGSPGVGPDSLIVDTQVGGFAPLGDAVASLIGSASPTGTGTNFTIPFEYDGASAIGIFLGIQDSNGFPFSRVRYDNVRIEATSVVPEASGALGFAFLLAISVTARKRPR